jgi:hypothetical protein
MPTELLHLLGHRSELAVEHNYLTKNECEFWSNTRPLRYRQFWKPVEPFQYVMVEVYLG